MCRQAGARDRHNQARMTPATKPQQRIWGHEQRFRTTRRPRSGPGTRRTAAASPTSTARSPARPMTRSCRSAATRCSSIRSERRTARRSPSCSRSCWRSATRRGIRRLADPDRRGRSVRQRLRAINPNSKIPALVDRSGPQPIRVFESGAMLLYLAEKFGAFLPKEGAARAECLSWLFWQMGSAPYLGGGFGHFYAYAPSKSNTPSTASPWRSSGSSMCSTGGWRDE